MSWRRILLVPVAAALLTACAASPQVPAEYRGKVRQAGRACPELSGKLVAAQLQQESGWDPRAESSRGAQGLAQFMPETWQRWGRDLNGDGTADPFDAAEAIDAQARLMCYLVDQAKSSGLTGDPVVLALAAYNAGWGPVTEHGGVPPFPETEQYVERILDLAARIELGERS